MSAHDVPELYYPFVSKINPNADRVRGPMLEWLSRTGLGRSEQEIATIDQFQLHKLAGMMYPGARVEQLELYARFLGWIFVVDDWLDEWTEASNTAEVLTEAVARVGVDLHASDVVVPGVAAFGSLLADLEGRGAPAQALEAFRSSVVDFLQASQWEMHNRSARRVPALPEYWEMGSSTVGVLPCVALLHALEGVAPQEMLLQQRLVRLSALAIRVTNDILSLERELRRGEVNNLLLLLMEERQVGVGEATALAAQYSDDLVRLYLECEARSDRIWSDGSSARLRNLMRASYDWGRWATTRYSACSGSEMVSASMHPG